MTVSSSWQQAYQRLADFTTAHPEITIDENRVSIPDAVRTEFYRLFDTVRMTFVQAHRPTRMVDSYTLVAGYQQLEQEVCNRLGAQAVAMPSALAAFLHNPEQALTGPIFDDLFALLRGRLDASSFERDASAKLETTATDLGRLAYPYWVSLALLKLVEPDQTFQITLDSVLRPVLTPFTTIPFGQSAGHPTLRPADLVVHSAQLDKYLAFKLALTSEIATYVTDNRAERKRAMRNAGTSSSGLSDRALFVYVLPNREEIPFVANVARRQVTPPDLLVETQWQANQVVTEAEQHAAILTPHLGTYIISLQTPSEQVAPTAQDFHLLAAGTDPTALHPLLQALAGRAAQI